MRMVPRQMKPMPAILQAVHILLEDEVGVGRDDDVGEAEERIGERQFDPAQHDEVRGHADDEGRQARGTPTD